MSVGRFADTLCENRSMKRKATKEGGESPNAFSFLLPLPLLFSYPPFFCETVCLRRGKEGREGGMMNASHV